MTLARQRLTPFDWYIGLLIPALMFVWPMQNTIALRNLLLVLFLGWAVYGWRRSGRNLAESIKSLRWPLAALGLLTVWMLIQLGWALAPDKVISEIAHQWLNPLAVLFLGISAARLMPEHQRLLVRLIFAGLASYVLFIDVVEVFHFALHGEFMRRYGGLAGTHFFQVSGSMDKANYLTNYYFDFLLAEFALKRLRREGLLGFGYPLLLTLFACGLLAEYVEDLRNGIVTFLLMALLTAFLTISQSPRERRRKEIAGVLALLLLVSVAVGFMLSTQQRWKTFLATVPIALDTSKHKVWLTGDWVASQVPLLPNGQAVSGSNYMRIAWAKEATLMLLHFPLGVGFQRQAFGYALDKVYHTQDARGTHSHSGILDLADGVGFPGLALWLFFIAGVLKIGWRRFSRYGSSAALLLLLVVSDYFTRSLVDSIIRDHMLEMFMFQTGFLMSCSTQLDSASGNRSREAI